jgi:hypothetical protein
MDLQNPSDHDLKGTIGMIITESNSHELHSQLMASLHTQYSELLTPLPVVLQKLVVQYDVSSFEHFIQVLFITFVQRLYGSDYNNVLECLSIERIVSQALPIFINAVFWIRQHSGNDENDNSVKKMLKDIDCGETDYEPLELYVRFLIIDLKLIQSSDGIDLFFSRIGFSYFFPMLKTLIDSDVLDKKKLAINPDRADDGSWDITCTSLSFFESLIGYALKVDIRHWTSNSKINDDNVE